ncbi:MAG: response regulator [Saprospiraceae bacterium]
MKRILVIEDNTEVRENLVEILELFGYAVEEAENGVIGVEKAVAAPPDLILCDVMMPELDGYGVLKILSQKDSTMAIPFIFLTARTEKEDLRRGMNLGADDYLTKPVYKDELLEVVQNRLAKHERLQQQMNKGGASLTAFIDEARGYAELKKLSTDHRLRSFSRKEKLFTEGDYPRYLFYVEKGKIKLYKTNDFGKEYIIDYRQEGDFVGYTSLISGQDAYTFSAAAMDESELRLIPRDDFYKLLYANSHVASKLIKMLANNVAEKEEQLMQLAYDSIRKRVADTLVAIASKESSQEFDILREDLAKMVGTAKESVIRTLTDFRESGYIDIIDGRIVIKNLQKLASIPG